MAEGWIRFCTPKLYVEQQKENFSMNMGKRYFKCAINVSVLHLCLVCNKHSCVKGSCRLG